MATERVAVVARKPQSVAGSGITVTFDAVLRETHTYENEVVTHPVEKGSDVTDHVRPKPARVVLADCYISNTPLSHQQQSRVVQSGAFAFTSSAPERPQGAPGYAEQALTNLEKLSAAKDVLTLVTTLRTYESMVIETIVVDRDAKTGDALKFTMTLKRYVVVENKQTRITKAKDKRVGKKIADGKKVTKPPEKEKSLAVQAADGLASSDNSTVKGLGNFILRQP